MCGIAGFFLTHKDERTASTLKQMSELLYHRGPDQYGEFISSCKRLHLAHRRLSIIDLSQAGNQPMVSQCGRFVLVFNGEIYNFESLRQELTTDFELMFRGHSDTEVLLNCIVFWGLEKTLPKLNGMFSFAVYDKKDNTVVLARDRFGEKPLYVYSNKDGFAFASGMRSIEVFTNDLTINRSAVDALVRYSYIPAPYSVYHEVNKLLPGHFVKINLSNHKKLCLDDFKPYWKVSYAVEAGLKKRHLYKDIHDAVSETERVLTSSISQRMVSDVPLGAFLSGGIDSTCITALMQVQSSQKIKTFSIGFHDKNYNEAQHAKAVASYLGTDHHEYYLDPKEMLDFIPKLSTIYDEPFADSSQLPTLMVSKFAKEHVSVALTGDAGDEVFCGYNRYAHASMLINKCAKIPHAFRSGFSTTVTALSPNFYNYVFSVISRLVPKLKKYKKIGDNIHKFARVLNYVDEADLYQKLIQVWPETIVTGEIIDIATDITESFNFAGLSLEEKMMWQDAVGYMQNDILTKVDRASMAVSLETRVPFLDNDVYSHAWSLPLNFKLRNGTTKYPLRKIIAKHIPDSLMNRPKSGFGVPVDSWIRKELKDWAESLLSEVALNDSGCFDVSYIRKVWQCHLNKDVNEPYFLWNVLMYQQWITGRK